MSDKVLFINSSPRAENSESIPLAEAVIEAHREADPAIEVDRLDVFEDLPLYGRQGVDAKMAIFGGGEPVGPQREAWDKVEAVAGRVRAADTLVFTVPMWNHTVNWGLKMFIDTISQPGLVFGFTPDAGYEGLLGGRRAVAIYTGSVWSPGVSDAYGRDYASGYFEYWLEWAGIEDVTTLRLQPTFGDDLPERRGTALEEARRIGRDLGALVTQS
jgi:FMN-dependent NADH-azoreductase